MEEVCRLARVEPVAVLLDTAVPPFKRRMKNLLRNIRANGWPYPLFRFVGAIRSLTTSAVNNAAVSRAEVASVLKDAFPDRCFSLAELAAKYRMKIHPVGNLNSPAAAQVLAECRADLGIVLGTRILKPGTFSVPRLGSINLHKGKVPEYRGMPPGFWELFDGASSAGVTVHFVDQGLDTGNIVATGTVPILNLETPDSLLEKLDAEGTRVLALAVSAIRDGTASGQPQEKLSIKPRSIPTRKEMARLRRKLPHWKTYADVSTIVRNLYTLSIYYFGIYWLVRQWHRLRPSRGAIFLYHRVNDYSKDPLTVDTETFAAQLLAISRRYPFSTSADIVDRIRDGRPLAPTTIGIHFDDCYRDILTNGAPIMKVLGVPACAFINSGFIGTERSFEHDATKYPFTYQMLRSDDVEAWNSLGFGVGAHTVNHVNLGKCAVPDAEYEIVECGEELEKIVGKRIDLFSFPFGGKDNINGSAREIVKSAGYLALFSAHGGFLGRRTDSYDIPRIGISYEAAPVYCLLQIEGIALESIRLALLGA
jgi:peptidoglycan/xylan/chitin deacetylase (PgdA/CDA1 family)/folate-dependent phosphoribosylglycinamide formyltransferase PurN